MADQNTYSNVKIGLSKLPEVSQNQLHVLAADFDGAETSALNVVLPNIEKIPNAGLIGLQQEWATQHDNDYVTHPSMTFQDRVNTSRFAVLLARHLAGAIVSTQQGATAAYDHEIEMLSQSASPLLKSSTLAGNFGGIDVILGGMVVNTLQIQMQNGAAPTFQAGLVGSGIFEYMADQTPALVIPAPTLQKYMKGGAAISFTLNQGGAIDYSGLHRCKSFNFQSSNNVVLNDRRAGDPALTPGDFDSGFYQFQMERGATRTASLTADIFANGNKTEFLAHLDNTPVTDISLKLSGAVIEGIYNNEVEIMIPQAIIRTAQIRDDSGKLMWQLEYEFEYAVGEVGLWKARVRGSQTTLA